ncbi:peptidase inhibitor family I36 protein [Streptomyces sp. NPDC004327]|uniref:peptidase inhibitor family I36 protein n=1 Tax=unclassified Streptomyces TaxID=2593676 RepID=UPI0036BEA313
MTKHGISRPGGPGKLLAALVVALVALVAVPGAASAADGPRTAANDFSAQAERAGLTAAQARSLQQRVDGYLAENHGTQIAANKIALPGGELLLTLPGERKVRDLDAPKAGLGVTSACPSTYVCAYKYENFTGDQLNLFTCNTLNLINWYTTGSWINAQRSTLYAKFYDSDKILRWTSPGGYSSDAHADWRWVWYLSPC